MHELELAALASLTLSEGVTMRGFGLALRHVGSNTSIICSGELSSQNTDKLDVAVLIALDTDPAELLVDTTEIHTVSADGITSLLRAFERCRSQEVEWNFAPGPIVADALESVELSWLFDPAPDNTKRPA